jgi:hypothetical protein
MHVLWLFKTSPHKNLCIMFSGHKNLWCLNMDNVFRTWEVLGTTCSLSCPDMMRLVSIINSDVRTCRSHVRTWDRLESACSRTCGQLSGHGRQFGYQTLIMFGCRHAEHTIYLFIYYYFFVSLRARIFRERLKGFERQFMMY